MAIFIAIDSVLTGMLVFSTLQMQRSLKRFRVQTHEGAAASKPSVSVCIPARNEMHAMAQCLERVLASDYKKLEIIVFDDSSADDTSILVRSFAHAGVRFVPGTALPAGWLGKNHALDILAQEASGMFVIFLDVDTFIKPTTISQLVGCATREKLEMISVIPQREDAERASVWFGPLRYFWQLILTRRAAPASSSALWMISRETLLDKLQGLTPFKNEVSPETRIASLLGRAYRCLISNPGLGVGYEKRWQSQIETSRRLLYPMVGGTWWRGVLGLVVLTMLNVPLFTLLSGFFFGWTEAQIMALWLTAVYMALYGIYTSHVWRRNWWLGGLLWPAVILQELVVFIQSWWGYARHTVTWKGRSVTAGTVRSERIEIDT